MNIRFNIIAGKINKIPEFYMIFARKMPDKTTRSRSGRGQMFEAEADAKILAWPRELNITAAMYVCVGWERVSRGQRRQ